MINMETKKLLAKLSNAHGVSGYEIDVRKIVEEEVSPYVDTIEIDKMGNLIATRFGCGPTVMLAAHMDEIGLMIKYVDDKGFAFFTTVGGWNNQTLLSMRVVLHGKYGDIYGVLGSKPPHLMKAEEKDKMIKADEMFIDFGATSKIDAETLGIGVGTPVTQDMIFQSLGNDRVTGKALDNRAGCVMLIETMRRLHETDFKNATVHAVFTVQEEVGLKGAKTAAYKLNPDVALATDVTLPGDHPGVSLKEAPVELGKGPAVIVSDAEGRGLIVPQSVLSWLKEAGKDIPYQLEVSGGGTTDGTAIHLTREGIPTGVLSISTRYIHTGVSVMAMSDLDDSIKLLFNAVKIIDNYF